MQLLLMMSPIAAAILLIWGAGKLYSRWQSPPDVIGSEMSDEWMRHTAQLLSKAGAGEKTYIEC